MWDTVRAKPPKAFVNEIPVDKDLIWVPPTQVGDMSQPGTLWQADTTFVGSLESHHQIPPVKQSISNVFSPLPPWGSWLLTPSCPSQSPTPGNHLEPQDMLQISAASYCSAAFLPRHQPFHLSAAPAHSALPLHTIRHPATSHHQARSSLPPFLQNFRFSTQHSLSLFSFYPAALETPPLKTCPFFKLHMPPMGNTALFPSLGKTSNPSQTHRHLLCSSVGVAEHL